MKACANEKRIAKKSDPKPVKQDRKEEKKSSKGKK